MSDSKSKNDDSISPFIRKTFNMVSDEKNRDIVCWSPDGNEFIVKNEYEFASQLLPLYFRHKNFSSFIRQLNFYNFSKRSHEGEYTKFVHPCFKKGNIALLKQIKRQTHESPSTVKDSIASLTNQVSELKQQYEELAKTQQSILYIFSRYIRGHTPNNQSNAVAGGQHGKLVHGRRTPLMLGHGNQSPITQSDNNQQLNHDSFTDSQRVELLEDGDDDIPADEDIDGLADMTVMPGDMSHQFQSQSMSSHMPNDNHNDQRVIDFEELEPGSSHWGDEEQEPEFVNETMRQEIDELRGIVECLPNKNELVESHLRNAPRTSTGARPRDVRPVTQQQPINQLPQITAPPAKRTAPRRSNQRVELTQPVPPPASDEEIARFIQAPPPLGETFDAFADHHMSPMNSHPNMFTPSSGRNMPKLLYSSEHVEQLEKQAAQNSRPTKRRKQSPSHTQNNTDELTPVNQAISAPPSPSPFYMQPPTMNTSLNQSFSPLLGGAVPQSPVPYYALGDDFPSGSMFDPTRPMNNVSSNGQYDYNQ